MAEPSIEFPGLGVGRTGRRSCVIVGMAEGRATRTRGVRRSVARPGLTWAVGLGVGVEVGVTGSAFR